MNAGYPHCAERLFGRAHAIEPAALRALVEGPAGRRILSGERPQIAADSQPSAIRNKRLAMVEADPVVVANGCGEYALTGAGIAIVPVMGILSQRFDWLAALCGWTTYEGLAATFDAMLSDYRVRGILLDVESPGGEAAGMLDAADLILAARPQKPVWAVANTFAASAAYALAGSAEVLFVPRLAQVGSIGAVAIHVDQSMADAAYGERFTAVFSGARKIDGWAHAPLSEGAQTALQRGVDYCRDQFAQLVGRQGRMSSAEAIATEAAMYHDAEAVSAKLADRVGSFDEALREISDLAAQGPRGGTQASARRNQPGDDPMAKKPSAETEKPAVAAAAATEGASALTPAAAPAEPAPVAASAALPVNPAPKPAAQADDAGETCPECGREIVPADGDNDGEGAKNFGLAAAIETMDLCMLGGASLKQTRDFIVAKTPAAEVREKLTAARAKQGDEAALVSTPAKAATDSGWSKAVTQVNSRNSAFSPKK